MCSRICHKLGADEENRTPDTMLFRHVLYQLSYIRILAVLRGLEPLSILVNSQVPSPGRL